MRAGKPLSKCGKCRRYMKYISARPQRLYCSTCEEVLPLPQVRGRVGAPNRHLATLLLSCYVASCQIFTGLIL